MYGACAKQAGELHLVTLATVARWSSPALNEPASGIKNTSQLVPDSIDRILPCRTTSQSLFVHFQIPSTSLVAKHL